MKVGVVEDHTLVRSTFESLLKRAKIDVMCFSSAEEFLESGSCASFDGLISDYRLPGMDGVELVLALRELGLRLPAVILSGNTMPDDEHLIAGLSNTEFIAKPCPPKMLLEVIKRTFVSA